MAQLNLEDIKTADSNNDNQVGFFTLKNNNEEAVVRFMYKDASEFEILSVHTVITGGKYRKANCLRGVKEPIENCPFCQNDTPIQQRIFLRVLEYVKDDNGGVTPVAKVWERSATFAYKLMSYLNNFGPLDDIICKIIRHGKPGDMKTEYEIIPNLNKNIYKDEIYIKDEEAFSGFSALGRIVLDKTRPEILQYIQDGDFPKIAKNIPEPPPAYEKKSQTYAPNVTPQQFPSQSAPDAFSTTKSYPQDLGTYPDYMPQQEVPQDVYATVNSTPTGFAPNPMPQTTPQTTPQMQPQPTTSPAPTTPRQAPNVQQGGGQPTYPWSNAGQRPTRYGG